MTPPTTAPSSSPPPHAAPWAPDSWMGRLAAHQVVYTDRAAVDRAVARLRELPPLVTSGEIERLKALIAQAQRGERFLLQGGDCAERIADCRPEPIARKLKILLQMSLVLAHASGTPVVRIGRLAGQYAKPRSSPLESRAHKSGEPLTLPSYYGDLVNREDFTHEARRPDPMRMVEGYTHAAITLNFIRSLLDAGFADIHHPENWDLSFLRQAGLPPEIADEYHAIADGMLARLRDLESAHDQRAGELASPEFFTSHEALNLLYESAQTRTVPRRPGHYYNLTTHLPWLGERTRSLSGAHVEYLRGIANPVGVKLGPACSAGDAVALIDALNPHAEPGKLILITRMGVGDVERALPPLIEGVRRAGHDSAVLWVCDPMHGNSIPLNGGSNGRKTRAFADIQRELELAWDIHLACGSRLGGVHLELTGDDVTECTGGASGLTEADLGRRYESPCDPRLNYEQSLELALTLAHRMARSRGTAF